MDLPPSPERPGWRRFFTDRVLRILTAVGVIAAAAVIIPTLTSEPRRDQEALRTYASTSTVDLNDDSADVSLELPSELTTVPATDGKGGKGKPSGSTTVPASSGQGSTTTARATSSTGATATTVTTTGPSITVPSTTATTPAPSCSGGGSAELSCLFDNYRRREGLPAMTRTGAMNERAQAWADKMAADGAMSHSSLDLIFSSCGGCTAVAENVGFNGSPAAAWQGWLDSATHRNNIRTNKGGVYGMGATRSANGTLWVVQMFGFN
ncbi:MAG: CAP domain-containing protein [Actinomycetota bacterium]|nr:CAP domain-containing protein [Actinomycetota bacterium]